jgi:hypothetical protein
MSDQKINTIAFCERCRGHRIVDKNGLYWQCHDCGLRWHMWDKTNVLHWKAEPLIREQ